MALKAIILDFDGVLVESNNIKHQAFAEIFKDFPDHFEEMMEFHANHNHLPRDEKFRYLYQHFLRIKDCEPQVRDLVSRFQKLTRSKIIECPYVRGAMDFIRHYAKKKPLYIASATPLEELTVIMKTRGLTKYFKDIFGAPMGKKEIFSRVLKAEHAHPDEVLFIGDSREDYQSAAEAGLCFVARISDGHFRDLAVAKFNDMDACRAYIQLNF
jgi:phosphoglycolate phosphatase-like HAD superfamily hydrolase